MSDVPKFLKHLKTYKGFPVPYTVAYDKKGVPDFKVLDMERWTAAVKYHKCGICGNKIHGHIYFVGGEKSLKSGMFLDAGMHKECAEYSFETCPYLRGDIGFKETYKFGEIIPFVCNSATALGIYEAKDFKIIKEEKTGMVIIKASKAISVRYLRIAH